MVKPLRLDIDPVQETSPAIIDPVMLKRHIRVDFDDDNDLLYLYVLAAVAWFEGFTQRTVYQRAHRWVLREFPYCPPYEIRLPRGKTVSVDSIEYSVNGSIVTLQGPTSDVSPPGTGYQEDIRGDSGGVIMPARGIGWPSVDYDVPAPVTINFTAGYAADDLPPNMLYALMFAVADAYDLRGTSDFNPQLLAGSGPRLAARNALASPYCLPRIY